MSSAAPGRLGGRTVLVTRPAPLGEGLCRLIESQGGRAVYVPVLRIAAVADCSGVEELLGRTWDLLIFVSRHAVEYARPWLTKETLGSARWVAAIGRATGEALARLGRQPDLIPPGMDSESLLAQPELSNVAGWQVLIVHGEGGRTLLAEVLTTRGATVYYAEVYRRLPPSPDEAASLQRALDGIDLVTVTSGEILENLLGMVPEPARPVLLAKPVVVPSERVGLLARQSGFQRVQVASGAHDEAVLGAVLQLLP